MDEDFVQNDLEERQKKELARLQQGLYLRIGAVVVFLVFGAMAIRTNGPGFFYFLKIGKPPIDIGNARALVANGKRALNLPSNSYVQVKDLMITYPAETKVYNFFYSPLLYLIVRTKLPLEQPKLRATGYNIPEGLLFLIEERQVLPDAFTTHFNAKGRLVKIKDFRGWSGGLATFYGNAVKGHEKQAYILFDGDTPWSHIWDAIALLSLLLGLILATWSSIRKRREIKELRDKIVYG